MNDHLQRDGGRVHSYEEFEKRYFSQPPKSILHGSDDAQSREDVARALADRAADMLEQTLRSQ